MPTSSSQLQNAFPGPSQAPPRPASLVITRVKRPAYPGTPSLDTRAVRHVHAPGDFAELPPLPAGHSPFIIGARAGGGQSFLSARVAELDFGGAEETGP